MFYLQTKDGERFFTSSTSSDRAEFEKILDYKLGQDAVEMFNDLIREAEEDNYNEGFRDGQANPI